MSLSSAGSFSKLVLVCSTVVVGALPAAAAPLTFDLRGNGGSGSWGNVRTFEDGGITLSVSAWGYTQGTRNNAFQTGALGQWSTGLGVCNRDEGSSSCGNPSHQVDNAGADDWALFIFSAPVDITSVRIDPYGNRDRDVSYYVGNVVAPLSLTGETYADLTGPAGFGFQARRSDTATASENARNVNIDGGFVNALLFGGYFGGSDQDDYFKIASISAQSRDVPPPPPPPAPVPEPATLLLTLTGVSALAVRQRMSRTSAS